MATRQHEAGTTPGEIHRTLEISDATCCRRQKHHGGMSVSELREWRQLREEPGNRSAQRRHGRVAP